MKKFILTWQLSFNSIKIIGDKNYYKEKMSDAIRIILSMIFLFLLNCESTQKTNSSAEQIPEIEPIILRTFNHDTLAFTQGLLYFEDKLFESTGLYNQSTLRCINVNSGTIEKLVPVENVFAEGLVLKNNIFTQLTWRSGLAFLYSYPDLKRIDTLQYKGEGWGLTSDGNLFIMSNGSDTLYWRDDHFNIVKKTQVTLHDKSLNKLNELEYARNKIYANVWYSDFVFEIEQESGKVLRMVNCRLLLNHVQSLETDEVLNGIAYNDSSDTFFLTGKKWPVIFEVEIPH